MQSRITKTTRDIVKKESEERKSGPFSARFEDIIEEKVLLATRVKKLCQVSNFEINQLLQKMLDNFNK